jgi:hypothetical protein
MTEKLTTERGRDRAWESIFNAYNVYDHDFTTHPFRITAEQIKQATKHLSSTTEREVRILCKQDTRQSRPNVFQERGLFILPVRNGQYVVVQGEGYVDIPDIQGKPEKHPSKLDFDIDTARVGNSEMQHLDYAFATSLVRTFLHDDSLVLTIRGRKYTPNVGFSFRVGKQGIEVRSVQTEVDAGYEGKNQVVLIEAKATGLKNIIIRQIFYPFRQWRFYTPKQMTPIFFEKFGSLYLFWQFDFADENDYNSIHLIRTGKFELES